jgi:hypothetical protein
MTTEQRIEQIKERADKATAGPWNYCESDGVFYSPDKTPVGCVYDNVDSGTDEIDDEPSRHNGYFIAHAREDVPFLLRRIEELKEWGQAFRVYGSTPDAALQCIQRWQADSIALQSIEQSANRPANQTEGE